MKLKIIIIVMLSVSIATGIWLFSKLTDSMETTNAIDVELISQVEKEDDVEITMIIMNQSDDKILDYKVGLTIISTNSIDVQIPNDNEPLLGNSSQEFKFTFPKKLVTYDELNINDFDIHVEGYINEVEKYNDFTLDADYLYYVNRREKN